MKNKIILGLIILLACVIRLVYFTQIKQVEFYDNPVGDAKTYVDRAVEIMDGKIIPDKAPFLSNAIYPYYLAVCQNLTAPRIIQFVFGILNIIVVYLIIKLLFGNICAFIGAFIAGIYPVFIFFEGDLVMISLVVFTVNISFLMFLKYQLNKRKIFLALGGIFLGLSALGKPDTIMLAPFIALWVIFTEPVRKAGFLKAVYLAVFVTVTILPLTILNWVTEKDFILLTSNGGVNFYIGNHPNASGIFRVPEKSGLRVDGLYKASQEVAQWNMKKKLKPSEVSKYWFNRGFEFIGNNPGEFVKQVIRKVLLIINRFEVPNHHSFYFYKSKCAVLKFLPLNLNCLIFFSVIGFILTLKNKRDYMLLYIYLFVMTMVSVSFFICDRYRLPTVTFYIVFASFGVVSVFSLIKDKGCKKLFLLFIPAVMMFWLSSLDFKVFDRTFKHDYKNLGNVYFKLKDYDKAVLYYNEVLRIAPFLPFIHSNIAKSYYMKGNFDLSIKEFLKEIEINPYFIESYQNLSTVYKKKGNTKEAERYYKKYLDMKGN